MGNCLQGKKKEVNVNQYSNEKRKHQEQVIDMQVEQTKPVEIQNQQITSQPISKNCLFTWLYIIIFVELFLALNFLIINWWSIQFIILEVDIKKLRYFKLK